MGRAGAGASGERCAGGPAAGGVGRGMALARRWERLRGGKVSLGAGKGQTGACFQVSLPLAG